MAKHITKWDMLKLSSAFEGSFNPADFSEEELYEMLGLLEETDGIDEIRRRYFEEHDDVKDRTLDIKKWSEESAFSDLPPYRYTFKGELSEAKRGNCRSLLKGV